MDGEVFRENRRQQQVVRVVPSLVPSTLSPHHPPNIDSAHVVSRHSHSSSHHFALSRPIHAVSESQFQSSAEREHRSIVHVDHYLDSPQGLRVPYPTAAKYDTGHVQVLTQRILRKHPRGVQNRAFPPDESKSSEKKTHPANPPRSCRARWAADVDRFSHTTVYEFRQIRWHTIGKLFLQEAVHVTRAVAKAAPCVTRSERRAHPLHRDGTKATYRGAIDPGG